ncbi:MAG: hypothetical protein AMJ84_00450 [Acidithiobacillales bacterium SM23_46]|nr:MAG: hypothetical protein AMJ84_00450 [Acidithiobacillales bacterium SM23_46]
MSTAIEELLEHYSQLPPAERAELDAIVDRRSQTDLWIPTVGPQLDAYLSEADILLYGGQAAGGKTDLGLGLAFMEHERSLVIRRQYTDLRGITDRAKKINTTDKGYNGSSPPRLNTINGKIIDFGALSEEGSEEAWQGQPHDLIYIDEVVQNREHQVRFLMGWNRTTTEGQRCRVVLGSNPPVGSQGIWIISMFAPWLDPRYPNPADYGELRWCVTDVDEAGNSKDMWVDGPDAKIPNGKFDEDGNPEYLIPHSRTFIPSKISDNPFLAKDMKYRAQLDALPEPLRSAIRDGNFMAARKDEADQVIPMAWVHAAQNRWLEAEGIPPAGIPQCSIGVDCARSKDKTVLAPRHDGFYPKLIAVPGTETPHGRDVAALVLKHRRNNAIPVIDVGEVNGAEAYAHLDENGVQCVRHMGMDPSVGRTKSKHLKFFNKRAEVYWKFMEALDPEQDGGSPIALPDDPELVAELCIIKWELTPQGIKVTPKKDVVKELGHSPDKADAVVMCWSAGAKSLTHLGQWREDQRSGNFGGKRRPSVNMGPRRRQPRRH